MNDDYTGIGTCEEYQLMSLLGLRSCGSLLMARKIGRPCIDCMQTVKQDVSRAGFGWNDLSTLTADRKRWKELTTVCSSDMERI